MAQTIKLGDPEYDKLLKAWEQAKKAVNFQVGARQYQAITPSDDEVVFILQSGFDDYYGSRTPIPGSN